PSGIPGAVQGLAPDRLRSKVEAQSPSSAAERFHEINGEIFATVLRGDRAAVGAGFGDLKIGESVGPRPFFVAGPLRIRNPGNPGERTDSRITREPARRELGEIGARHF